MISNPQQPYYQLSSQILDFFYPVTEFVDPRTGGMQHCFSPINIQDFMIQYSHFHVHSPLLHAPTFKIADAHTGLLIAMCCTGACYSDRVPSLSVREMTDYLWGALKRDCAFLSRKRPQPDSRESGTKRDVEEMIAVSLTVTLLLWNGSPRQRQEARQAYPLLASRARALDLLQLPNGQTDCSPLHDLDSDPNNLNPDTFQWDAWIYQEQRVRAMHGVYLLNVALGLYFNVPHEFHPFELRIPLPCDDEAWDADNSRACAEALGLCGEEAALATNPFGTRRLKQPNVDLAAKALLHLSYNIQPGTTNLYGKFIVVHVVLALIRSAQLKGSDTLQFNDKPPSLDWLINSRENNVRTTPVDELGKRVDLDALSTALDKFKANWDVDMHNQFPPLGLENPKRHGFSRDGIHYYWLAKHLLKHTQPVDLQMPPDLRFMHVMWLVKSVRAWVMSDAASRGEELGSMGEIDNQYGHSDLTLDMSQLFKALPRVVEGVGTPVFSTAA